MLRIAPAPTAADRMRATLARRALRQSSAPRSTHCRAGLPLPPDICTAVSSSGPNHTGQTRPPHRSDRADSSAVPHSSRRHGTGTRCGRGTPSRPPNPAARAAARSVECTRCQPAHRADTREYAECENHDGAPVISCADDLYNRSSCCRVRQLRSGLCRPPLRLAECARP